MHLKTKLVDDALKAQYRAVLTQIDVEAAAKAKANDANDAGNWFVGAPAFKANVDGGAAEYPIGGVFHAAPKGKAAEAPQPVNEKMERLMQRGFLRKK